MASEGPRACARPRRRAGVPSALCLTYLPWLAGDGEMDRLTLEETLFARPGDMTSLAMSRRGTLEPNNVSGPEIPENHAPHAIRPSPVRRSSRGDRPLPVTPAQADSRRAARAARRTELALSQPI